MGYWKGKYVIGLTGNIGTGKSVVRRMLEHLGAYGIDADALAHRAIANDAPGYKPLVENFGKWILDDNGQIDRARLGRVVFSDPEALKLLESIVHPLVRQAIDFLIKRSKQPVIVIEAIKLLEVGYGEQVDAIWVTTSETKTQISRLMRTRNMPESEARQRITVQGKADDKIKAASLVIKNDSNMENVWNQVVKGWKTFVKPPSSEPEPGKTAPLKQSTLKEDKLVVLRGGPRQSADIVAILNRLSPSGKKITREDIMTAFGEKAYLLLQMGQNLIGVIGWQVENLVARTTDIVLDPEVSLEKAIPVLVAEMEKASRDLQCEASLIFVSPELANHENLWNQLGYERRAIESLGVVAWQEAARETMTEGAVMLFKKLRQDRILRPI